MWHTFAEFRRNLSNTKNLLTFKVLEGISPGKYEMVGLDRETSNTLFEVLADWEHQLHDSDFINILDELEDRIEGPQP